jgi:hypothetical protein
MHRLHVLIVIASFIIALRGLQVLQIFGVIPKSSLRKTQPCSASGPYPPYAAAGHAPSTGSSSSSSDLVPLVNWLASNGADIQHVNVADFNGLRGLQVTASRGSPAQSRHRQMHMQQTCMAVNCAPHAVVLCASRKDALAVHSDAAGCSAVQALRAFNRHDVILAVPTNLTVSFGTFSAA